MKQIMSPILGFYYFRNMLPHNISYMFCTNDKIHDYNTRNTNNFHRWVVKTNMVQNSVRHQFPLIWYTIPRDIRSCNSLNSFKRSLKKHLIAKYIS